VKVKKFFDSKRPHENLIVWQKSIDLVKEIYGICKIFPKNEEYGLISQLKRAAVSVPTNIAEGAARNSKKEFIKFLYIALGSLSEIETLLFISKELFIIDGKNYDNFIVKTNEINIMLNGLIKNLKNKI